MRLQKTTYIYSTLAAAENPPNGVRIVDVPGIRSAEKLSAA
jgi:hypothetical protein